MAFAPAVAGGKGALRGLAGVDGRDGCVGGGVQQVGVDRERRGIGGGSQWLAARHNDGRTSALTFSTCRACRSSAKAFSTCFATDRLTVARARARVR